MGVLLTEGEDVPVETAFQSHLRTTPLPALVASELSEANHARVLEGQAHWGGG
jgi:hypothetical protein